MLIKANSTLFTCSNYILPYLNHSYAAVTSKSLPTLNRNKITEVKTYKLLYYTTRGISWCEEDTESRQIDMPYHVTRSQSAKDYGSVPANKKDQPLHKAFHMIWFIWHELKHIKCTIENHESAHCLCLGMNRRNQSS